MSYSRKRSRPPSLRERLEASHRTSSFYAAAFDKTVEKPAQLVAMEARAAARAPRRPSDPDDTEAPVKRAVGELLAAHPLVLLAVRQNSGAMHVDAGNGRSAPIWFYKIVRRPGASTLTFTDYWGFLRDGRPFAIECKRPAWRAPREARELNQQAFIHMIEAIGGVGGFARSADEANAILGGA